MSVVTMRKLLEAGAHYGHQTRKWNPKMKPYIYTSKANVYILDLNKTLEKIDEAYAAMKAIAEKDGKVLFVGTKRVAQPIILEEALRAGAFYINQRWLGGTLTNFKTIQKRIKRLIEIEQMEDTGTIGDYTKKEQALIRKEGTKLENFLGGIKEMRKLPDAVFVVEPMEEHNAVTEAKKLGIPVFGICDTNCDPDLLDYPIPANDDSAKSIKLIVGLMADAIVEAKGGLLEVAYTPDEQPEVTMEDVIVNVDQQNAERERRRRALMEERRQQMAASRGYNGRGRKYPNDRFNARAPRPSSSTSQTAPAAATAGEPVADKQPEAVQETAQEN